MLDMLDMLETLKETLIVETNDFSYLEKYDKVNKHINWFLKFISFLAHEQNS